MREFAIIKINELLLKTSVLVFPAIPIVCFLFLKEVDYDVYVKFVHEDSLVEYVTSAFYLLSSIVALFISIGFIKERIYVSGIFYIFFAFVLMFAFGEEISWGQRILGIATPQFFVEHSSQKEINIHNLYPIQGMLHKLYILVGAYGSFLWLIALSKSKKSSSSTRSYFVPRWYLMSYFLPVLAFYVYFDYIKPYNNFLNFTWREQEPAELILSIGLFLFVLVNRFRQVEEFKMPEPRFLTIRLPGRTSAQG